MSLICGIDFGTTNSAIAVLKKDFPEIIPQKDGSPLLPSVVAFNQENELFVGREAKAQKVINPERTIFSIKSLLGRSFSEIAPMLEQLPYKIIPHKNDQLRIVINKRNYAPEEIAALILMELKESAENYLNQQVREVVISVPAYYNDSQRQATRDAAHIAGLKVLRMINEPTAAALAYALNLKKDQLVAVYDFGGGTIDISLLKITRNSVKVLVTNGDTQLGGNDLDKIIIKLLLDEFYSRYQIDLSENRAAMQRLYEAAELAKIQLSSEKQTTINLPFISATQKGPLHLTREICIDEFEKLIRPFIEKTVQLLRQALQMAGLEKKELDCCLLVGGSSRIPMVRRLLEDYLERELYLRLNPEEIVALGAATQAAIHSGELEKVNLYDVIPLSLGVKTHLGQFVQIIAANTPIPVKKNMVFTTVEDFQTEVEIAVYQGERPIAEENKLLGKFALSGIKPAPQGYARIEVCFEVDQNGIMKVSAIDLSTNIKNEIEIRDSGLLSEEELEKIVADTKKYFEQDKKRREFFAKKNHLLNQLVALRLDVLQSELNQGFQAELLQELQEFREKIEDASQEKIESITQEFFELCNKYRNFLRI